MNARSAWLAKTVAAIALACSMSAAAAAQGRTDVVTLGNGDRITGEVVRLDRGRLEFKTDDIGRLYLEWDNLVSLVTTRLVEVTTADGLTFLGSLGQTTPRSIAVASIDATAQLAMPDVHRNQHHRSQLLAQGRWVVRLRLQLYTIERHRPDESEFRRHVSGSRERRHG